MPRTLVVSRYFPPAIGGTPTVLKNLFRVFHPDEYYVLSASPRVPEGSAFDYHGEIIDFPQFWRRYFRRLLIPLYLFLIPAICLRLRRIVKKWGLTQVLILYPDPFFAAAGYFFVRCTGLPYMVYFHDLFEEAQTKPSRVIQWLLAKFFEKGIVRRSRCFFVVSEGLRDFYQKKYGVEAIVVPHSIDLGIIDPGLLIRRSETGPARIVYTGGVYDNQRDAFIAFVRALRAMKFSFVLTIASRSPRKYFEDLGILKDGDKVIFFEEREKVFELQRNAEILYLPLAFHSPSPWEVKTSIPTKLFEYAASMRPIFVHCPPDSSLAKFCLDHGIGEVCISERQEDIFATAQKLLAAKIDVLRQRDFLQTYDRDKVSVAFRHWLGYQAKRVA